MRSCTAEGTPCNADANQTNTPIESNQVKQANVYGKACRTDSCSFSHTVYSPVLKALLERQAALFHNVFPHLVFKWCSVRKVWRIHCSKMLVFSLTEIWWLYVRSTICIIVLKVFSEPWTVCRCCIHYRKEHDVKHDLRLVSRSKCIKGQAFCILSNCYLFFFYKSKRKKVSWSWVWLTDFDISICITV